MSSIVKLLAYAAMSAVLLAACAQAPAPPQPSVEIGKQLEAVSQLADGIIQLQGVLLETSSEFSGLEAGISAAEDKVSGFVAGAQTHALGRTADIAGPPDGRVAFRLGFT